jgi:cytochrome c5
MNRFVIVLVLVSAAWPVCAADPAPHPGRKLYVAKCARCHELYDPAKYSREEWAEWLRKMQRKSRLTANEIAVLQEYADAARARTNAPPR